MEEEVFNFEELNLEETTFESIMGINPKEQEKEEEKEQEKEQFETKEDATEKETSEEGKEKVQKEKTPSSDQEDISTFSIFANLLKEEGVISLEDEDLKEIKTSEDLVNAVRKELENSKFSNLSESQKRYLESIESGLPSNEFEELEIQIRNLENLSDERIEQDIQTRFDLIAYDWINKGIPTEKAEELANRSLKLGTDIEDAREARESLLLAKSESFKNRIKEKQESNKISLEKVKSTIDSKTEILNTIKLNPKDKEDLFNLVTTKVGTDSLGQPLNAVNKWRQEMGIEADIILGAIYKSTNGFKDLNKIIDKSKSIASKQLEEKLRQIERKELSTNLSVGGNEYTINV